MSKTFLLLAACLVGLIATPLPTRPRAQQQTFLPPMFQLGGRSRFRVTAARSIQSSRSKAPEIRVAMTKSGSTETDDTRRCGSTRRAGTVWAKAR